MPDDNTDREVGLEKFRELIADVKTAMLTTVDVGGQLRSRPMMTVATESSGELWFFTGADTGKIAELVHDRRVNVAYAAPDKMTFVSVSGSAELVRDRNLARKMWSPLQKAWFPQGVDDPNLVLLKVNVEYAEYWDAPHGRVQTLFGILKAAATGQRADDVGEHGHLAEGIPMPRRGRPEIDQ